jgi:outer membrane protein OmpA-like peptidoglycan-associated protein
MSTGSPTRSRTTVTRTTTTTTEGYYWERCRRGALPWIVGAVGLAAAGIAQFGPIRGHVESDLTDRSKAALEAAGLTGITVDFSGRDARLTGNVASQADVDRALAAVRGLEGVRVATADLALPGAGGGGSGGTGTSSSPSPSAVDSGSPSASISVTPSASVSPSPSTAATAGSGGTTGGGAPSTGPVQQQLVALPQVTFAHASAALTPSGKSVVAQAAAILKANPTLKVRIDGHTDDQGDWDANKALSTARAQTVRQTLIALGVDGARLTTFGWSEERPKVPNTSEANRAVNRRVEFVVLT